MAQTIFVIELLLACYTTQSQAAIQADCNADVTLNCSGTDIDSMDFLSVAWYKFDNQKKLGIIRRGKDEDEPQPYNFTRPAMLGEKYSLLLSSVKPEDSGTYDCAITAKVGQQNLNFSVDLTVHECVIQTEATTTTVLNITQPTASFHIQVKDLPVMWSIVGYVALSLLKITLCLLGIWVVRIRYLNRQQHRW